MGKYVLKKTSNGQFRFNLHAGNGQIILTSEAYTTKAAARKGIASVLTNSPNDGRYVRQMSKSNQPYFCLKAANGQVIGNSQMYRSEEAMENGVESVKSNGSSSATADETTA